MVYIVYNIYGPVIGSSYSITGKRGKMTTNAQKRVLIAQDVIEQLNTEEIKSTPGCYLSLRDRTSDMEITKDTQVKSILDAQPSCNACALGATFVSMMRRYNECTVGDLFPDLKLLNFTSVTASMGAYTHFKSYLERLFEPAQLQLIEIAYEGINTAGTFNSYNSLEENDPTVAAHEFHMWEAKYYDTIEVYYGEEELQLEAGDEVRREDDGSDVLRAIMNNIIKNKGTFVP